MNGLEKGSLPDGWRWAQLGEVAKVFAGSAAPQGEDYFDPQGPRFVRVSDLGQKGNGKGKIGGLGKWHLGATGVGAYCNTPLQMTLKQFLAACGHERFGKRFSARRMAMGAIGYRVHSGSSNNRARYCNLC